MTKPGTASLAEQAQRAYKTHQYERAAELFHPAAALDDPGYRQAALTAYEHSAHIFSKVNEKDMRALVLNSAAGIKLKRGCVSESAYKMMGALKIKANPSLFERIPRLLLHFRPW